MSVCLRMCLSVCLSVCQSAGHAGEPCKTAEPIEMQFERQTHMGLRNLVLDADAHWLHLANTNDRPVRNGDVDMCRIA